MGFISGLIRQSAMGRNVALDQIAESHRHAASRKTAMAFLCFCTNFRGFRSSTIWTKFQARNWKNSDSASIDSGGSSRGLAASCQAGASPVNLASASRSALAWNSNMPCVVGAVELVSLKIVKKNRPILVPRRSGGRVFR